MSAEDRPQRRPNVIWFFSDQHRAQAMGCAGDPNVSTPHMDAFTSQGVWFNRAVSNFPWCCPFRASLLTGLYPQQHGVIRTPQRLDPAIPTIAPMMGRAGYETAYFGKWHLAWDQKDRLPRIEGEPSQDPFPPVPHEFRGGFDTWLGFNSRGSFFDTRLQGHTSARKEVELDRVGGFETDVVTDLLLDFVRGQTAEKDRPFFAVCSVTPPHPPYVAPEEWMRRYDPESIHLPPNVPAIPWMQEKARQDLAAYYAMVENLDHNLGRLMTTLKETGLAEQTHVMFFSDHGDMHWSHGYRDKSQPWEESIRIPFVIGGAGGIAGRQVDALLGTVDIIPTTLGLCGIQPSEGLPGFDYSSYATNPVVEKPLPGEPDSVMCGHFTNKLHGNGMNCTWRALVTQDGWKYVCTENAPLGMFNLNDDPYEQHNLLFKEPYRDKQRELLERLRRWIADTGDTYPLPG